MRRYVANALNNNSIWAIAFLVIRAGINIILTPYITNRVGIDSYGYIALANNFVMYIDIICVAFNYFAGRNIAVSYHSRNGYAANSYYSTILTTDLLLMLFFSVSGVLVISYIEKIIHISPSLVADVKILFFLVLMKYFLTMFGTTLEVSEFIKNRLDICNKNKILSYLVYAICVYFFYAFFEGRVYYVGIALVVQAFIYLFLQYIIKRALISDLRFDRSLFSRSKIREFISKGIWISFNNLGNILNDGLDLLITNIMISESMVGMISISKMIGNLGYSVVGAISNSLNPKQLEDYSKGNIDGLIVRLHRSMTINGLVYCVFISIIVGCGKDFFLLWMGMQDVDELYLLTILATTCFFVPSVVKPLYYVYVLTQNVRFASYVTITMGLVNTASMFFLIKYTSLGGYAVLLTTSLLNLVHLVDAPLYAAFCLKQNWKVFYQPILRHTLYCLLSILWANLISNVMPASRTWFTLGTKAFLCILATLLIVVVKRICDMIKYKSM